ncbi:hypothetical protein PLESTB_000064400 [Pleodorina starrii]|uniref:HMG box domain-containing protein n=1 Tax=Pleodorina starrii TaxID=330485 RepID=A0A9W6EWX8_9CHLO|nr:hypothetical protein PLESTM_001609000 [Pleodorina starrii]GLC48147.1 hypothetical protein PLESTB_000064400 [Pleodorina starrii]GLC67394.1 hypothetical protein PLESTF_000551500 [Pleodorina starrii]
MRSLVRCTSVARRTYCVAAARSGQELPSVPKKASAKAAAKDVKNPELKRAPSAFNLFVKDVFPMVKKEAPTLSFTAASQKVREQWLSASNAVKAPYEAEAAKLKAAVAAKRAVVKAEEKAKARPPGAYILFVKKNRAAVVKANPGKTVMEVGALMGQQWKALAPEEQQKYKDEAKTLLDAWRNAQGAAAV